MNIELKNWQAALKDLPEGVTGAEVCADRRSELLLQVKDGEVCGSECFDRTALYVRASGEKTGTILSEKLDEDPRSLMKKALEGAAVSQRPSPEPLNAGGTWRDETGDESASTAELRALALEMERAARSLPGVSCVDTCQLRKTSFARRVLNSNGLDRSLSHTGYLAILSLRAKREGKGPAGKAELYVDSPAALDVSLLAKRALDEADRMDGGGTLEPVSLPSGRYPAVFSAAVTRNIMITAWMAMAGERMRSGRSLFSPDEDMIASPLVSVVNDPTPPDWSVDYRLDSEGTLCEKCFLVKDGRLETPMLTLSEAEEQGRAPTGNAGRVTGLSGTTPVGLVTVPACVYIAPGQSTVDELLEQMGTGLYLTYSLDVFHSINVISGQFSIPCGGILYRDGAPVGTVDQLTMAGDLRSLLAGIRGVGNDLSLEEFMFYHNYSYGGPSLLTGELTFAGQT